MMSTRLLVPAVLAAGAALLTACGQTGPATGNPTPRPAAEQVADELDPVTCGDVDLAPGGTQTLVADPAAKGLVGCEEAFNVIGEYLAIPAADRDLNGTPLADGWSCTTDDGAEISVGCVKGGTGAGDFDLSFHTEPPAG